MSSIDAYYAGYFDGEGCIQAVAKENSTVVVAKIGCTDELVLLAMQQRYGGTVRQQTMRAPSKRSIYLWRLTGTQNVQTMLDAMLPYLVIKKERAEIASALNRRVLRRQGRTLRQGKRVWLTQEELSIRSELARAITDRNQIGERTMDGSDEPLSMEYLAGLFDAEGTIIVPKGNQGLRLMLGNTNGLVIRRLHVTLGGSHRIKAVRTRMKRALHHWDMAGSGRVREVLMSMLPLMQVKRQRAELAIDLANRITGDMGRVSGAALGKGRWLTTEERNIRNAICEQMRHLNQNGE